MAGKSKHKLAITLPSDLELVATRVFDAPRHLVYRAWLEPELVLRWWCCMDGFEMPVCEIDARVGGAWRFVMRGHGSEFGFHGEYRELVPSEKIVMTQIYEPFPELTVVTMTFEERDGATLLTSHTLYSTKQGRDGHIASGMEGGANIAFDRMEEIAQAIAATEASRGPAPASSPSGARP